MARGSNNCIVRVSNCLKAMIKEVYHKLDNYWSRQLMILNNFVSIGGCFNVSMTDQSKSQQIVQKYVSLCYVFSSHIFFTAGLEAPRGIFFDLSIVREENPFLSEVFSPFSLTIFRQDTCKRCRMINFRLYRYDERTIPISTPKHQLFSTNLQQSQEQKFYNQC